MKTFSRKWNLRHFLIASLLLHTTMTATVIVSHLFSSRAPVIETVQLEIVEPTAPVVAKSDENEKRKKAVPVMKNQIVDQSEQALNDEKPEDARFLSRHNQVVNKQTVAKNRGEFQNKATKETVKGHDGKAAAKFAGLDLKPKFDVAKAMQDRSEREAAFEKAAEDGTLPIQADQQAAAKKQEQGGVAANKGGEVSQSLDYIKDLDSGLETLLSTKEFVYYSYFNRIRTQLNQYWTDKVRQKLSEMYKKGRMIASSDDKVTKCLITLDATGKLIKVQIIGDSGVRELDEAAVEAFRSAAPFPNPPTGMKDPDGTIKIRWDFILEA